MKLIIECRPGQRLAELSNVKHALLDLGYSLTITPAGDLLAHDPGGLETITLPQRQSPTWPPRKLRAAP